MMKVVVCYVDEYLDIVKAKIFSGGNFSGLVCVASAVDFFWPFLHLPIFISPHSPPLPLAGSYRLRTFSNESHTFLYLVIDAMKSGRQSLGHSALQRARPSYLHSRIVKLPHTTILHVPS